MSMSDKRFYIDQTLAEALSFLSEKEGLTEFVEVDEKSHAWLCAYQDLALQLNGRISDLTRYKQREIDAFAIGDAIADGICLTDGQGIVQAINQAYTDITGLDESQIVGHPIEEILAQGYFNRAVTNLVIEQKKKISQFSTITKNKKKVLITGNPFFNEAGEVVQVLTVMRDLTEIISIKDKLEKAEKESERYLDELNYYKQLQRGFNGLIGESNSIKKIRELISYVAKTEATVLITGETGVGKEVIAREIHQSSNRAAAPYIKVNCAAIPDSLLESELFGYEKGAFTGAQSKEKPGMFEMANGGTLLLDEIGEMPMNLQSKLLRVLQERELMRIGGTKSIKIDVRVLASTNQNLTQQIKSGRFREDLYYRLNVVPIHIPPLRERLEDLPLLTHMLLEKFNQKYEKDKEICQPAMLALSAHHWPGNVRELSNVIERIIVSDNDSVISEENVLRVLGRNTDAQSTVNLDSQVSLKSAVEQLERELITNALAKYKSTYKAAEALGTSQPTLFRKAKQLGIATGQE